MELDLEYYGNKSGNKIISPLVYNLLDGEEALSQTTIDQLASLLYKKWGENWKRVYAILEQEYNPIENYSMVETHEGSDTETDTPTDWVKENITTDERTETSTDTPTDWSKTIEKDPSKNIETQSDDTYGFNSVNGVPKGGSQRTVEEETVETQSGKFERKTEHEGDLTVTEEQKGTYEKKKEYDTTLRRSGNIGVTTSQQMIQSEFDLWGKTYRFVDYIYITIDDVLTLSIY